MLRVAVGEGNAVAPCSCSQAARLNGKRRFADALFPLEFATTIIMSRDTTLLLPAGWQAICVASWSDGRQPRTACGLLAVWQACFQVEA